MWPVSYWENKGKEKRLKPLILWKQKNFESSKLNTLICRSWIEFSRNKNENQDKTPKYCFLFLHFLSNQTEGKININFHAFILYLWIRTIGGANGKQYQKETQKKNKIYLHILIQTHLSTLHENPISCKLNKKNQIRSFQSKNLQIENSVTTDYKVPWKRRRFRPYGFTKSAPRPIERDWPSRWTPNSESGWKHSTKRSADGEPNDFASPKRCV